MGIRLGLVLFAAGWFGLCTFAEAQRRHRLPDDPVLRAGLEAGLAGRYCPGLRTDIERFRVFEQAHHMGHADFYTRPRPAGLDKGLAGLRAALRADPAPACDRLWTDYGTDGRRVVLLRRA